MTDKVQVWTRKPHRFALFLGQPDLETLPEDQREWLNVLGYAKTIEEGIEALDYYGDSEVSIVDTRPEEGDPLQPTF